MIIGSARSDWSARVLIDTVLIDNHSCRLPSSQYGALLFGKFPNETEPPKNNRANDIYTDLETPRRLMIAPKFLIMITHKYKET